MIKKIKINGKTYKIEGKSAYEIAVEHGFVGTEEEWLESLKGESGVWVEEEKVVDVPLTYGNDGYYDKNGKLQLTSGRNYAIVDGVSAGEVYRLDTRLGSALIPAIVFFDDSGVCVGYEKLGTGTSETVDDYEFIIQDGVTKIIVQSASASVLPTLQMVQKTQVLAFYTKDESDKMFAPMSTHENAPKRYGLRWQADNPDDLGERCFDAVGKSATIGKGATNGQSDFDNIYPWSQMKRCNIKTNQNGASVVTFEGEDGFALDGSNGDVFVRIPKFYMDKYNKDGYEYIVISEVGTTVHPTFVEDGKEVDEIFVSAFEGFIDANNRMRSIGGKIPANNRPTIDFLTSAQANGTNYTLYDMRAVDALWMLVCIEYGCRNTNRIFGYGLADFLQPSEFDDLCMVLVGATNTNSVCVKKFATNTQRNLIPEGSNITICNGSQFDIIAQRKITKVEDSADGQYTIITFDGSPVDVTTSCFVGSAPFNTNFCETCSVPLAWHTGRANWMTASAELKNPIRYRWIENLVGNVWHFLPDVMFNDCQMYVCKNMKDYQFASLSAEYKPIGDILQEQASNGNKQDVSGVNFWISKMLQDPFAKGLTFGKEYDQSLTSTKAFGAYYYLSDGLRGVMNGGGFDHAYRCNMLTHRAWIGVGTGGTGWFLYGARLLFKKIV